MSRLHIVAPGTRVLFRGNGHIEIVPPAQGFPVRSITAGPWALAALEQLAQPSTDEQLMMALEDIVTHSVARQFCEVLVRFGIARRYHAPSAAPVIPRNAGFLLFALGAPRYGQLAYNVALSIKYTCPAATVAVCHHGQALEALSKDQLGVFDRLVECAPSEITLEERFEPLWAKLHADKISPFDSTIVVDVDSVFFPGAPLAEEFVRYAGHDFAPTCTFTHLPGENGPGDRIIVWADVEECVRRFSLTQPIRQVHLFYFAFSRTAATHGLFQTARETYLALKTEPLKSMRTWYSGRVSAELAMSIATARSHFSLYSEAHVPIMNNAMTPLDSVERSFLGFTFCGAPPDATWQARYDAVVRTITPEGSDPLLWGRIHRQA